ncbi:MAG: 4-hydroxythreonine-4-phosphate dehydrogenase PdxA [Bacteroidetes bacterium]|nr:4-hydroxythreonine-4-phosphate dehydrogenase PdxA [Bacteroidota bacterium]
MIPRLYVSCGDPNGIGPDIAEPALRAVADQAQVILCIPQELTALYRWPARAFKQTQRETGLFFHPTESNPDYLYQPGQFSVQAGKLAFFSFQSAVQLTKEDPFSALLTLPVNKKSFIAAGSPVAGHTELIGLLLKEAEPLMILLNDQMRVALLTVHIPIMKVSQAITPDRIRSRTLAFEKSLRTDFGIEKPAIAVLGLNPHAGEDGSIGTEEKLVMEPTLAELRADGLNVEGPFPSDGFFGNKQYSRFDGILAAYHDQGLIPLKLSGMDLGVNFSAGSQIVRTSPDHGTAYDIAGKGLANPSSTREAARLALHVLSKRHQV